MSYESKAQSYGSYATRSRIDICATEQAYVFINDARPEFIQLSEKVIGRMPIAIDALAMGVCASPNGDSLDDDGALLSAMQSVWPSVSNALYDPPPDNGGENGTPPPE